MADPSVAPSVSVWTWISGALLSLLTALMGIYWKQSEKERLQTQNQIEATQAALATVATKEELKAVRLIAADAVRHDEYEQNRREMREDMSTIHLRIDKAAGELNSKVDNMGRDIHNQISTQHTAVMAALAAIQNK